jgi:hypothetical protein
MRATVTTLIVVLIAPNFTLPQDVAHRFAEPSPNSNSFLSHFS